MTSAPVVAAPLPPSGTAVVVGASLAGLWACEALRRGGFAGSIVLVGQESVLPYDRPPLSKGFLAGTVDEQGVQLRSREQLDALALDLRLGVRAVALDLHERRVSLDDGTTVAFDGLVVATGASPREWSSAVPSGVATFRSVRDATALRMRLAWPGLRLVVVGGGFLGMEIAATATVAGATVTVVEPLSSPLARVVGPVVGEAVRAIHEARGVRVLTGRQVAGFVGHAALEAVCLDDGTRLPADAAVVAIGVLPCTSWLTGSGLRLDDGVVCDATLRASHGLVVAAGDVARAPHPLAGGAVRLEHWTSAADQARHAAGTLLAGSVGATPFASVPYFWSDQFDVTIQSIGIPGPEDEVVVVDGSPASGKFVSCHARGGRLVAAVAAGRPRQLMAFRPLLERGAELADALRVLA